MDNTFLNSKQLLEKDLNILAGIIDGIEADGNISESEIIELNKWISNIGNRIQHNNYSELVAYIKEAISDNFLSPEEREEIINQCNHFVNNFMFYTYETGCIQRLEGFLKGITLDKQLNDLELFKLDQLLESMPFLAGIFPYDELYTIITHILQDGIVTTEELNYLYSFIEMFNGADKSNELITEFFLEKNIYHIDPKIEFTGKNFTITGVSKKYKRSEIQSKISEKGGFNKGKISGITDYLIVCADKNIQWAFTAYGRKIQDALNFRKNGAPIVIVHEFDLYDHF